MSDFDYGNARLRVMKSRLLTSHDLEALTEAETVQSLTVALIKTPYRKAIETTLAHTTGLKALMEAFQLDLIDTATRIRQFYSRTAGELAARVLSIYDIHNIKTILRGFGKNISPAEIISTLLPVGDLSYNLLVEIAHTTSPRVAIDQLASLNFPVARPLLKLRGEHPGAEIPEMELALDKWFFHEELCQQEAENQEEELFKEALKLDADITNLLTVLRFIHTPTERKLLRERFGADRLEALFVGPGRIPFKTLLLASSQTALASAVGLLSTLPYKDALQAGLASYLKTGRLSDFENQLQRMRLQWMAQWIVKDPLGIGVLLGYLALKINEIRNLYWISKGINLGLDKEKLRQGLLLGSTLINSPNPMPVSKPPSFSTP